MYLTFTCPVTHETNRKSNIIIFLKVRNQIAVGIQILPSFVIIALGADRHSSFKFILTEANQQYFSDQIIEESINIVKFLLYWNSHLKIIKCFLIKIVCKLNVICPNNVFFIIPLYN